MTTLAEEAVESPASRVFTSVARGLTSDLSPAELLHLAVRLARRLLEAERATILLLEGDRLVPEVSVARNVDEELFARFRDMPPITLHEAPQAKAVLEAGKVVVVDCAAESSLVPSQWRDAFGLQSLAIAPLVLEGKPCGILVVEGNDLRLPARPSSLHALASIAAMTAMGVGGSRRQRSAAAYRAELAAVRDACISLRHISDVHGVADVGVDALLRLFQGDSAQLVLMLPDSGPQTVLRRGGNGVPLPRAGVPVALEETDPAMPSSYCAHRSRQGIRHDIVTPIREGDRLLGFCLTDAGDDCPSPERLLASDLLADGVAQALDRIASAIQYAAGGRLRGALLAGPDLPQLPTVAAQVASILRESTGTDLVEVVVCRPETAAALTATRPAGATAQVLARWRRSVGAARPVQVGDLSLVPLLHDGQLQGALKLRRTGPPPWGVDRDALVGLVAQQTSALLVEVERRLAGRQTERQLAELRHWKSRLVDLAPRLRVHRAELDSRQSALGLTLDGVLTALARPTEPECAPLTRALSALVRSGVSPRTSVQVKVRGTARPLSHATDLMLRRLAEELAFALEQRGRASQLLVELRFGEDAVTLLMRDDGLPLSQRSASATRLFEQLRALARRCDELGGSLDVSNLAPLGVLVTATLPHHPPIPHPKEKSSP